MKIKHNKQIEAIVENLNNIPYFEMYRQGKISKGELLQKIAENLRKWIIENR